MITMLYSVQCDGSSDDEDADYFCKAEFEHWDGPGCLGDLTQLRRQLSQRGWRVVPADGGPMQVFCPLHRTYGPMPNTDGGADWDLVHLVDGKPSCARHGAMNKVSETPPGFWRCLHISGCRAGCQEQPAD